ncbi:MAG: tyrosine-type recombinase/integrase, partial [Thermogutta sp.]
MASLINRPNGHRWIQFVDGAGRRQTIRLGRVPKKTAETVFLRVEGLLANKLTGTPPNRDLALWLAKIEPELRNKLAAVGLCERRELITLGDFLAGYVDSRNDVGRGTKIVLRQAARHVMTVLGADTRLDAVTPENAARFKAWLIDRGCSRSTVAKWCRYARHFFTVAVQRKLITENPFAHVRGGQVVGDPARRKFIPAEEVLRVLNAIPDAQWRAVIILARWGGLRIPSEAVALQWSDVNWERGTFIVRSPKTAHHKDGGIRVVPLFPEVRAVLDELWDTAKEGEPRVIPMLSEPSVNLRTQLARYCERAGVVPWIKPFQNMRASRATELADMFPSHVCAAWLGHTEKIADAFYRQVTDEHIAKALALPEAKQNPKQYEAVSRCTTSQEARGGNPESEAAPILASSCDIVYKRTVGGMVLEHCADVERAVFPC